MGFFFFSMAKRFIDTGFYKSPFVRSLKGPSKALYSFIICDCTGAGVWMKDLEVASLYIGLPLNEADFAPFVDSGKAVEVAPGKFFFPDFIDHQYPSGLSEKNAAHKNFLEELLKYNVLTLSDGGAYKPLERPFEGSKVMVMAKEEAKVTRGSGGKTRPTAEEILAYMTERNQQAGNIWPATRVAAEAKKMFDHYTSNGWKVGRNAMKDWQAAARNWMNNSNKFEPTKQPTRHEQLADLERIKRESLAKLAAAGQAESYLINADGSRIGEGTGS